MESMSSSDAHRSLETIGATRQDLADRLRTPRWYYPLLGLLVAQMVAAYGLLGNLLSILSALVVAVGAGWLVRTYAGRTGIVARFPDTLRSGFALALFGAGILAPVLVVVFGDELRSSVVLALAATAFLCTVVLGPVYDASYRADLRRGARA